MKKKKLKQPKQKMGFKYYAKNIYKYRQLVLMALPAFVATIVESLNVEVVSIGIEDS